MYKEIVILAKSSKHGEYCIAGIDTSTGEWIRPISNNTSNEGSVPIDDIIYSDGNQVEILDKVRINILSYNPTKSQPENYIYDNTQRWVKTGSCSLEEIIKSRGYDKVDMVFYNDRKDVLEGELDGQGSLLFLNVKNSYILIKTFDDGNRRIQLNFEYNNKSYKYFGISDKVIQDNFRNLQDGVYNRRDDLSVVISLTDKFTITNKYYKMIAQIFY